MTMTKSPVSTWEVKIALCLPRSSTAAFSATRPTTWLSASIIYHLRSTCSALALKVFIGSRKLSHAARDVSKIFAVIFVLRTAVGDRRTPCDGRYLCILVPKFHLGTPLIPREISFRANSLQQQLT